MTALELTELLLTPLLLLWFLSTLNVVVTGFRAVLLLCIFADLAVYNMLWLHNFFMVSP
jgi:hypothetical protein